jgi:O-antigen/teichoic acid export membrane protein
VTVLASAVTALAMSGILVRSLTTESYASIVVLSSYFSLLWPAAQANALGMLQPFIASHSHAKSVIFFRHYVQITSYIFLTSLVLSASAVYMFAMDSSYCLIPILGYIIAVNEGHNAYLIQTDRIKLLALVMLVSRFSALAVVYSLLALDDGSSFTTEYLISLVVGEMIGLALRACSTASGALQRILRSLTRSAMVIHLRNKIVIFGVRGLPLVVLPWLVTGLDRSIINGNLSPEAVAAYGAALALSSVFSVFNNLVSQVFSRIVYSELKDYSKAYRLACAIASVYVLIVIICGFGASVFVDSISRLCFGREFAGIREIFAISSMALMFNGVYRIFGLLTEGLFLISPKTICWLISALVAVPLYLSVDSDTPLAWVASIPLLGNIVLSFFMISIVYKFTKTRGLA